jgi:diguanylate cyclase (GGDEF)-like protein/PAS domain S-box-containing protein
MNPLPQEFEHQFILQSMGEAIIAVDLSRRILWTNTAFTQLFGYQPEEAVGRNPDFVYADRKDYEEQGRLRYNLEAPPVQTPYEMRYVKKDGQIFWGEAWGAAVHNRKGDRIGFMVAVRDISRRKQLIHDLHLEKEQWFVTLKSIGDAVVTTDEHGQVTYVNPVAEHLTGWKVEEAVGQPVSAVFRIVNEYSRVPAESPVERALLEGTIVGLANHTLLLSRSGEEFSIEDSAAPIRNNDGQIRGCIIVFRDVTEKRKLEQRIAYQANFDSLTDLPNRHLFQDRLSRAIGQSHRKGTLVALLYLDVDYFKNINDRMGHPFGDRVLVELGKRLKTIVRDTDTIARIGGDEFAVILCDLPDRSEALALGRRLMIEAAMPFRIDGSRADLTVSIGVALYPEDGTDATALIRNADIALYQVKREGRNNIVFFSREMNRFVQSTLKTESELREALDKNRFYLVYQPIVQLESSLAVGVEALLRWRHRGKVRFPDEFVPIAEEMGLILPLGQWILREAIRETGVWIRQGIKLGRLTVNVSVKQIHAEGFADFLESTLRENDLPPSILEIEITERTLMFRDHHTLTTLNRIREMGVKVSIDDFGIGYSSLNYIRNFPVNTLKIDRSFLAEMLDNHYDRAVVRAILAMAQSLSIDVVAEGVERLEQARFLQENGCLMGQGFFYSEPVSPEEILRYFRRAEDVPGTVTPVHPAL